MDKDLGQSSPLTRRSLAGLLIAVPLVAQVASPPPKSSPPAQTSSAVDDVRKVSERLAQTEVPMSIEPAFSFHV
jgi:hypothetical protein